MTVLSLSVSYTTFSKVSAVLNLIHSFLFTHPQEKHSPVSAVTSLIRYLLKPNISFFKPLPTMLRLSQNPFLVSFTACVNFMESPNL